jgi:hypothetical protein
MRNRAADTKASNSERNSPVFQKFSGCHCTPTQNGEASDSMASITPSLAVALTTRPFPTRPTD